MPFLLLISLLGVLLVLGLWSGLWLIGVGFALLILVHLPVARWLRLSLLVGAVLGLVYLRTRPEAVQSPFWTLLASLFMFRLMVYLYETRRSTGHDSVWQVLSYFFLLPNVAFPLFPVVDYDKFKETYSKEGAPSVLQRGIRRIFRGIIQLILYRFVYAYFYIAPTEAISGPEVIQFALASFLLYVRVSGIFHIVVGILNLFGFDLPETNHFYYLSSSINDFWRRANIYWKDFMVKIFFYPIIIRLRRWTGIMRLAVAVLGVVLVTALLHSYQWFWLRGELRLSAQDLLFWGLFGALMLGNSLYEMKRGRRSSRQQKRNPVCEALVHGLKITATFAIICLIWSLWTAPSLSDWTRLLTVAGSDKGGFFLSAGIALVVVFALASGSTLALGDRLQMADDALGPTKTSRSEARVPLWRTIIVTVGIVLLFLVSTPQINSQMNEAIQKNIAVLQQPVNAESGEGRGYYEALLDHWLDATQATAGS